MPPNVRSFRARYDALEQRRAELIARLEGMSEKGRANPAFLRARMLLSTTFRKAKLAQRAAILEAAEWMIALIDRTTSFL